MFSNKILMCEPTHFQVKYSINPWMNLDKSAAVDHKEAMNQWRDLHHLIIRLGGFVEYVEPWHDLPDQCFTANAGLFHNGKVVLAKFRHKERQGESMHFFKAFDRLGYEVMTTDLDFEGAGDAFVVNDTLFLGSGFRTDYKIATSIMDFLGLRSLVRCDLVDPNFYHLDTCFCPLENNHILFYPGAFSPETLNAFTKTSLRFITVDESEARRFACNAVSIPTRNTNGSILNPVNVTVNNVILPTRCERTSKELTKHGYIAHMLPMTQFLKAGGACKCLTLKMSVHS